MRAKRPRGLAGYTPDWRERMGAPSAGKPALPARRVGRRPHPSSEGTPGPAWKGRRLALLLAVLEGGLLVWLVAGPALPVRSVRVEGATHLTAAEVVRAAGLANAGSILTVNGAAAAARLDRTPWVRTSAVTESLPGAVTISVQEWRPAAVFRAGPNSTPVFLNAEAEVVGPAPAGGAGITIMGPAGPRPRDGSRPVDPLLLAAMGNMERAFPSVVGLTVSSYGVDASGDLTLVTSRGWPVLFGRVLTPEQFAALDQQLAALKSVSACVDFKRAPILYVNVMNPSAPDVRFKAGGPKPCR
ncbi:MAG: cell division protein FtsQ/DivIB [Candidatus Dormibacterales bacterium]